MWPSYATFSYPRPVYHLWKSWPGVHQLWTQDLKPDFKGLNVHFACFISWLISTSRSSVSHLLACPHREAHCLYCFSCCQTLNWIIAVCELSPLGKAIKCQQEQQAWGLHRSCLHLLWLPADQCREGAFVLPFLHRHVPAMGSQLTICFCIHWCIHSV